MKYYEDVCLKYSARMTRKHKKEFRDFVVMEATKMGYKTTIEKGLSATNLVIGDVENAKYLITAHYDTPPRLPKFFVKHMFLYSILFASLISVLPYATTEILENFEVGFKTIQNTFSAMQNVVAISSLTAIAYTMGLLGGENKTNVNDNSSGCLALLTLMDKYKDCDQEIKNNLAFVFFDNEEKFLFGSKKYAKEHKEQLKNQTIINLDCVGLGKNINVYYTGKQPAIAKELDDAFDKTKGYQIEYKKSGINSMSDHVNFKKYNSCLVLTTEIDDKKSLYKQIHSSNDSKLNFDNIETITQGISQLKGIELREQKQELTNKASHKMHLENAYKKEKTDDNQLSEKVSDEFSF